MTLTQEPASEIENCLEQIYAQIFAHNSGNDQHQIRQYIDVGEYGLALDDMASFVVEKTHPATSDLKRLFEAAAERMNMKPGAGWGGVDALRTAHAASR